MSIVPLGLGRTSVALQTNRAYNGLQSSQSLLSRYEQQLLTQRQYQYGSDSPYQASTALAVQAQMERKAQNAANVGSTLSYLSASDSTLSKFNSLTDDVRGMALDAVNTVTDGAQRRTLAQSVKQITQQLFDFGNYSYQNRYVFSGASTSTIPFEWGADSYSVTYRGSESNLYSWSDTDILSQTNMNGVDVFGAISDPIRGLVDLDPTLSTSTRLSDLNGGKGVEKGSIRLTWTLNDQQQTFDVDLSRCATVGDVIRTLENHTNPYFSLKVDLTPEGLQISLPKDQEGTVSISEVGKGSVARQLGVPANTAFSREAPLQGRDINPALTSTTALSDILGSKATTILRFAGANNDIRLQARHNGDAVTDPETGEVLWDLNGVNVQFQSDADMVPGSEYAEYDPETKTILVHIHPDNTNANAIVQVLNDAADAGTIPPLTASLSETDQQRSDLAGTGIVSLLPGMTLDAGTTSGGSGVDFDPSGLEIFNGNTTHSISFEGCKTVGDVLAELNDPKYGLQATINDSRNGIDIRSRVSGADFCIGENGGATATQLGVRSTHEGTRLEDLDFGRGVNDYDGPGIAATASYAGVTPNSALLLRAKNEGEAWNGYTVNFVPTDDPQGKVLVSMDEDARTINIAINPGVTTACEVIAAFESQPGPQQYFELVLDNSAGVNTGEGVVYDGFVKTSGGVDGGTDFTITRNDGTLLNIDIKGAETIGDVLRIINEHPENRDGLLVASLSEYGNGIELTDRSFGNQVTRVDRALLSTAAIELGLVDRDQEFRTKTESGSAASLLVDSGDLNASLLITAKSVGSYANDVNVEFVAGDPTGFSWDAASKTMRFAIEPGVTTANDVIEMFQTQASETVRSMFDIQNGPNPDGTASDGRAAISVTSATMQGGSDSVLKGGDPNPQETESLYNALIRMQVAMENDDVREIERASGLLEEAVERITESRSTIGVMQNSLDNVKLRLSDETLLHEGVLNDVLRIDYASASLNYLAQQVAYQGALQVTTGIFQLSLLNYL